MCLLVFCSASHGQSSSKDDPAMTLSQDKHTFKKMMIDVLSHTNNNKTAENLDTHDTKVFRGDGNKVIEISEPKINIKDIKTPHLKDESDVQRYIEEIALATGYKTRFSIADPQVAMIKRMGAHNVNVILETAKKYKQQLSTYVSLALQTLADESNKHAIINSLDELPELIDIIQLKSWQHAARDEIINTFKMSNGYELGKDWFFVALSLNDEEVNAAVLNYYYRSFSPADYFFYISTIVPEKELKPLVNFTWKRIKNDKLEALDFAPIAMQYSNPDALQWSVAYLQNIEKIHKEREKKYEVFDNLFEKSSGQKEWRQSLFREREEKLKKAVDLNSSIAKHNGKGF